MPSSASKRSSKRAYADPPLPPAGEGGGVDSSNGGNCHVGYTLGCLLTGVFFLGVFARLTGFCGMSIFIGDGNDSKVLVKYRK